MSTKNPNLRVRPYDSMTPNKPLIILMENDVKLISLHLFGFESLTFCQEVGTKPRARQVEKNVS